MSLNTRFGFLWGVYQVLFCVVVGFSVPYLQHYNFSVTSIGLAMTGMAASCALLQPFWGYIADKYGHIRLILGFCSSVPLLFLLVVARIGNFWIVALMLALSAATLQAMLGMIDSWAAKLIAGGLPLSYGPTRSAGSVAYAFTSVVFGYILGKTGLIAAPAVMALFIPVLIITLVSLPEPAVTGSNAEKTGFLSIAAHLFKRRDYRYFITAYFFSMLTFASLLTYYPIWITELGGTDFHLGMGYFVMAGVELIGMSQYKRLRRRFSYESILMFSFFFFGVRNLFVALAPNVSWAIAAQATQLGCYALFLPSMIEFISSRIDKHMISTSQLIANAIALSVAQIIGNFIYGTLAASLGMRLTLLLAAIPAVCGAAIFYTGGIYANKGT